MIRQLIRTQREDPLPAAASMLVAVALAAPWLLDFNASHPAVANHIAFAMAFGPLALMVTALRAAAATCIAGGAWLIASPWVLGYASTGLAGWLADLLIGATLILLAFEALTGAALQRKALRPSPRIAAAGQRPGHRRQPAVSSPEEEKDRSRARRRTPRLARWLIALLGGATVVVVAAAVALAVSTSPPPSSAGTRPLSATADPTAGLQRTRAPWPAQYTFLAQRLAGLALPAQSDSAYHIHAFLSVFINGRQITIPTNLGIDPKLRFLSPIHAHDSTGIIHMEASRPYPFTLGQLFTIWGVRFSDSQIGAYRAAGARHLAVFANGRRVRDPVHYVMRRHDSMVVGYGTPASFPHRIAVTFPPGL